MMLHWVALGIFGGILLAFATTRTKMRFRKKLLSELEIHSRKGTTKRYISSVIEQKDKWMKSASLVRKPFTREINLAIETGALLLALLTLVNAVVNFNKVFDGPLQGMATLTLIGAVIAYIPCEWIVSGKIEKDFQTVLNELREAMEQNRLDAYMANAKEQWKHEL